MSYFTILKFPFSLANNKIILLKTFNSISEIFSVTYVKKKENIERFWIESIIDILNIG